MAYVEQFADIFSPISIRGVLFLGWLATFVLLPVIREIWGSRGERAGTAAGVVASVLLVAGLMAPTHGFWAIAVIVGVPVLGWLSEFAGSRTGIPFGAYHYTNILQPQVGNVPALIPLAWLMMMPSSWAVGTILVPDRPVVQWLIAGAAFTSWDLFVDPQMVSQGYWVWKKKGAYAGIPLVNYLGWFIVAFAITAVYGLGSLVLPIDLVASVSPAPFLAVFIATWFLQSVGHWFFWKLRTSAIVGFVGMGVFVVLVAIRLF